MARKKKEVASVEAASVEAAPVEVPMDVQPVTYTVTLDGAKGQSLAYGINGVHAELPCGVELTVAEGVYQAIKAHVIKER